MNIFQQIFNLINNLNSKFLEFRYRKYLNSSNKNGGQKCYIGKDYSAKFSCKLEENKKNLKIKVTEIIKNSNNNPNELISYIESNGTKIYKVKKADKILALINETEGFITPKKGLKALYLNIILNKKVSFKLNECFIFKNLSLDFYYLLHHFYNWYAFKSDFAGYEYETQENFNQIFNSKNQRETIKNLSISEILAVKEAINRDMEAINFVIELAKNNDSAKKIFKEMLKKTSTVKI